MTAPEEGASTAPEVDDPVVLALGQLGGKGTRADLLKRVTRHQLQHAVATKRVERPARGRYCLPDLDEASAAAVRLHACASHRSAALVHGWEVRRPPPKPEIVVARHRNIPVDQRRGIEVRWRSVTPSELKDRVTAPLRTVIDCARDLPLEESLVIADAARRADAFSDQGVRQALDTLPRTGRAKAELVLLNSSAGAANVFESTLRALSIEAVGPVLVPQVSFHLDGRLVRPDLMCRGLRLIVEADSVAFHTSKHQLIRDCWRYDEMLLANWLVLRFTWNQVMFSRDWVISVIRRAVAMQQAKGLAA